MNNINSIPEIFAIYAAISDMLTDMQNKSNKLKYIDIY